MAAALAAHEAGLSVLIVEKSSYVGGSTARSGGALWLPASQVMRDGGAADSMRARADLSGRGRGRDRAAGTLRRVPGARRAHGRHAAPYHADEAVLGQATTPTTTRNCPAAARPGAPASAGR